MLADAGGQYFAAFLGKKFRIAQAANAITRIENDGGSNHAAEKRPAPDLIHSSHELRSLRPGLLFITQSAAQALQKSELRGRRGQPCLTRLFGPE
jgi:hypothetical protein